MITKKEAETSPAPRRKVAAYGNALSAAQRADAPVGTAAPRREADLADSAAPPEREARPPRIAVLAIHGMGQQVPFETLEYFWKGLTKGTSPSPTVTNVSIDSAGGGEPFITQRLELVLSDPRAGDIEVHVYEGYWAPITEGRVTLRDVFRFLSRNSFRGLRASLQPFRRWMFAKAVEFPPRLGSALVLLFATYLLALLAILNLLIPVALAAVVSGSGLLSWLPRPVLAGMTVYMDLVIGVVVAALVLLGLASFLKTHARSARFWRRTVELLALLALAVGLLSFVLLPVAFASLLFGPGADAVARLPVWLSASMSLATTWAALLLLTKKIRRILIEYLGDVAAYISPQALDRFNDIRTQIKESVARLARHMLAATDDRGLTYEAVVFVGHSLGSVIAYDVANKLIVEDSTRSAKLRVLGRLRLIMTIGSPLDKTAFIFGLHGQETRIVREQVAAAVQPLIEDYKNRAGLKWINIYSRFDIVSGMLDFYDTKEELPPPEGNRVRNVADPDARIPLIAHTEYWQNDEVWTRLREQLVEVGRSAA